MKLMISDSIRQQENTRLTAMSGLFLAGLAGLAITGLLLTLTATRLGAGLSDDSYAYIRPVRDFLAGGGLHPDPLFPPLLPAVLSLAGLLAFEPLSAIRFLNAGLFGISAALAGLLVWRGTGSQLFGLAATALMITSEQLLGVHAWALSEPLYLALALLALYLILLYAQEGKRAALYGSAAAAGLAALTRYAGVALAAAIAVFLVFYALRTRRSARHGLLDAVRFGLLSLGPLLVYLLRNQLVSGTVFGARANQWETFTQNRLESALFNLLVWFIPGRLVKGHELALAAGLLFLLAAGLVWLFMARREALRKARQDLLASPLVWLSGLFILANYLLLFASRGTFGKGDAFNDRYLSPAFVAILVLGLTVAARLWAVPSRVIRLAVAASCLVLGLTYAYRTAELVPSLAENGAGYASARWHVSETIRYLNNHPQRPVVSTGAPGIYFWTGRLPRSIDEFQSVGALHAHLREQEALLVIIDSMPPEMYGWEEAELVDGLELLHHFGEGSVYQAP